MSDASFENEIHNKDSKNIFFLAKEALILEEERLENFGKWPKTGNLL